MLLAIDPSIRSCGVALFDHLGALVATQRITSDDTTMEAGARCLGIARSVKSLVGAFEVHTLVSEWPQIYTAVKSKGDPNDLPPMAGVGCALAALLEVAAFYTPHPADWIRQIPKTCPKCKGKGSKSCRVCGGSAWRTPRGDLIRESLTPAERTRVPDQHDVIDAVGIGLWKLKRLVTGRVFPGAV